MAQGDHIYCSRGLYTHHGIDVGGGQVIHFTGTPERKRGARVTLTSLEDFAAGDAVHVQEYGSPSPAKTVVRRARGKVGTGGYNLLFSNCEHFARWCKTGEASSKQASAAVGSYTAAGIGGVATAASVGVVGASGAVAGLSGAGVMSGLAAVGGAIGAGAVGGLVALGAAPAALGTAALNLTVFRDDEYATAAERAAAKAGRMGTSVGCIVGSAGGVGAVASLGTVGLSGAGITSGLAAVGAVVGGGMVAGTAVVIAAPLAVAAVAGFGAFTAFRFWKH